MKKTWLSTFFRFVLVFALTTVYVGIVGVIYGYCTPENQVIAVIFYGILFFGVTLLIFNISCKTGIVGRKRIGIPIIGIAMLMICSAIFAGLPLASLWENTSEKSSFILVCIPLGLGFMATSYIIGKLIRHAKRIVSPKWLSSKKSHKSITLM